MTNRATIPRAHAALDPETRDANGLHSLLGDALVRSERYLDSLGERPVTPSAEGIKALTAFDVPLQNEPMDPREVLRELDEQGTAATMAMAGPRFFGFVIGGTLPAALAAHWLSTAWDQNTG